MTIACGLARSGPVTVDVYDGTGHKVRSLASGVLPAGVHQFHWNGRNQQDQPASQGVYFFRMQVGGQVGQKNMTLTRRVTLIR